MNIKQLYFEKLIERDSDWKAFEKTSSNSCWDRYAESSKALKRVPQYVLSKWSSRVHLARATSEAVSEGEVRSLCGVVINPWSYSLETPKKVCPKCQALFEKEYPDVEIQKRIEDAESAGYPKRFM
jgi:hypothetical protein